MNQTKNISPGDIKLTNKKICKDCIDFLRGIWYPKIGASFKMPGADELKIGTCRHTHRFQREESECDYEKGEEKEKCEII